MVRGIEHPQAGEKPAVVSTEKGTEFRSTGDDLRKAAIFVLALEESVASELLRTLSDEELEVVTAEIARLGVVEQEALSLVLEEFHDLTQLHGVLKEGGPDQAIRLVERSFPPDRSRRLIELLKAHRPHLPLAFLSRAETDSLLDLLAGEHPQMVAVVLAHMTPSKAAEVLDGMDDEKRREVIERVTSLQGPHQEVIQQLEQTLRKYLDSSTLTTTPGQCGGVQTAADILRASGRSGRNLLSDMRPENPDLVEEIYQRLFVFEDLERLDDLCTRKLLEEVETERLALSLKSASPRLKEKVLRLLSHETGELVLEEMEQLGPVRVADVKAARQSIVEKVLELEESGEIRIGGWPEAGEDRLVY